jgi:hypothetical protein
MVWAGDAAKLPQDFLPYAAPIFSGDDLRGNGKLVELVQNMAQLLDGPDVPEMAKAIRTQKPQAILSVRMTLTPSSADRILELSKQGLKVFHLCADLHGCERTAPGFSGRHIKDVLRDIHGRLVNEGCRDEITLIVSGGIALAEHMAKAIICGADLVAADTALLVSLGCRVCRGVHTLNIDGGAQNVRPPSCACPAEIGLQDGEYAVRRFVNLIGAWHSQLIEVLGAMGIREVRRLRGEMGRAIFMEEIEKEAFGDLASMPLKQEIA